MSEHSVIQQEDDDEIVPFVMDAFECIRTRNKPVQDAQILGEHPQSTESANHTGFDFD